MDMKNRVKTGDWDGEPISRPKTLGERHPNMFKKQSHKGIALDRAKVSKEEIVAKIPSAKIKKLSPFSSKGSFTKQLYGHEKKRETMESYTKSVDANKARHKALSKHKELSKNEQSHYQK